MSPGRRCLEATVVSDRSASLSLGIAGFGRIIVIVSIEMLGIEL